MRNDVGQPYVLMRGIPGVYVVSGDPDEHISLHSSWTGAKDAFIAAVTKEKMPLAKRDAIHRAASHTSSGFVENTLMAWSKAKDNIDVAEQYIRDYPLVLMALAYANGLAIAWGSKFIFVSGTEDLPAILDEFEKHRYPRDVPKPKAGSLTMEELNELLAKYATGGPDEAVAGLGQSPGEAR